MDTIKKPSPAMPKIPLVLSTLCIWLGSFWACYMPTNTGLNKTSQNKLPSLPTFSLNTLEGVRVDSQDYAHKILLVDFWATWCPPCVEEIPHLNNLYSTFQPRGVEFLGISMDSGNPEIVRKFILRYGMKYPVVMGNSSVGKDFGGIRGLPTTFILDQQGTIVKRYDGYRPAYIKDMRKTIEQLLG